MNDKTAKRIRKAASVRGSGPAIYKTPEIHHLAEAPVYITHTRTIRELGPVVRGALPNWRLRYWTGAHGLPYCNERRCSGDVRRVVTRTVEKTRYRTDGKTPLGMRFRTVEKDGKPEVLPETTLLSVAKPLRLKPGTPRAIYRLMKRLERRVGLDTVFNKITAEAA